MKIPFLHSIEKKIRRLRKGQPWSPDSSKYKARFNAFLEEWNYTGSAEGEDPFIQPKVAKEPIISIIIPCYNQFEYTRNCINSIARNTEKELAIEIIIIDDKSTDETKEIEKYYPELEIIRNEENRGFLRNVNHAAKKAKGHYLLLLNNDTIVLEKWLSSMLYVFEHFDNVGAVGSKLIFPNGMLQEAGGYISIDQHFGNFGKGKSIFNPRYNYTHEVDYVSGACLLMKKKLWHELGGFDEIYLPAYFEDTDLCMRIRQEGLKVFYTPFSNIIHFESISYGSDVSSKKQAQLDKNQQIFTNRWQIEMEKTHLTKRDGEFINFERKEGKPTILYIDEEPPNNYACGSKLTKLYCELLVEMGFCVKYLPMHISRSSEKYINDLTEKGIECYCTETGKGRLKPIEANSEFESWYKPRKDHFEHLLLARPGSKQYLDIILKHKPGAKYHYHPADLHFLREERTNLLFGNQQLKRQQKLAKKRELFMLQNAETILHVSSFEDEYLRSKYHIHTGIIIPCLFFEKQETTEDRTCNKTLMFVGGSHPPSLDGLKWFLDEIFPKILLRNPETVINIVGDCGKNLTEGKNINILGKVTEETLKELYRTSIAVIPLRVGAGVKGKVLEAMNYETPFVTTSIGLEGIIEIESAKKPAETPEDFAREVCEILEDPSIKGPEVAACSRIINSYYTKAQAKKKLESIFV